MSINFETNKDESFEIVTQVSKKKGKYQKRKSSISNSFEFISLKEIEKDKYNSMNTDMGFSKQIQSITYDNEYIQKNKDISNFNHSFELTPSEFTENLNIKYSYIVDAGIKSESYKSFNIKPYERLLKEYYKCRLIVYSAKPKEITRQVICSNSNITVTDYRIIFYNIKTNAYSSYNTYFKDKDNSYFYITYKEIKLVKEIDYNSKNSQADIDYCIETYDNKNIVFSINKQEYEIYDFIKSATIRKTDKDEIAKNYYNYITNKSIFNDLNKSMISRNNNISYLNYDIVSEFNRQKVIFKCESNNHSSNSLLVDSKCNDDNTHNNLNYDYFLTNINSNYFIDTYSKSLLIPYNNDDNNNLIKDLKQLQNLIEDLKNSNNNEIPLSDKNKSSYTRIPILTYYYNNANSSLLISDVFSSKGEKEENSNIVMNLSDKINSLAYNISVDSIKNLIKNKNKSKINNSHSKSNRCKNKTIIYHNLLSDKVLVESFNDISKEIDFIYLDFPSNLDLFHSYNNFLNYINSGNNHSKSEDKIQNNILCSNYYKHIEYFLLTAYNICEYITNGADIILDSSKNNYTTLMLTVLVQIMLDPYYRTIDGLIVLLEKEMISHGLNSISNNDIYYSNKIYYYNLSLFLTLECIYQLISIRPYDFQYNKKMIIYLMNKQYDNKYISLIANNEKEFLSFNSKTIHIWVKLISISNEFFINQLYSPINSNNISQTSNSKKDKDFFIKSLTNKSFSSISLSINYDQYFKYNINHHQLCKNFSLIKETNNIQLAKTEKLLKEIDVSFNLKDKQEIFANYYKDQLINCYKKEDELNKKILLKNKNFNSNETLEYYNENLIKKKALLQLIESKIFKVKNIIDEKKNNNESYLSANINNNQNKKISNECESIEKESVDIVYNECDSFEIIENHI